MSDLFRGPSGDITTGHPTTRNLAPAPDGPPPEPTGPLSAAYPEGADQPTDAIAYGPDIATESTFRLLGNLADKRVLAARLRVGGRGHRHGPPGRPGHRRRPVAAPHRGGPGQRRAGRGQGRAAPERPGRAAVRAGRLDRRGPQRVRPGQRRRPRPRVPPGAPRAAPRVRLRVLAAPPGLRHARPRRRRPATAPQVVRSYFDRSVRPWFTDTDQGDERIRTIGDLHTSLSRANFRVDTILEPEPAGGNHSAFWTDAMDLGSGDARDPGPQGRHLAARAPRATGPFRRPASRLTRR